MATPRLATWQPPKLTKWQRFRRDPAGVLGRWLHSLRPPIPPSDAAAPSRTGSSSDAPPPITIVCISDTHQSQPQVPDGDLLLHAGDLTNHGSFEELQEQLDWLASLPHKHKIVIAGNHDRLLDPEYVARFPDRICETEEKYRSDLQWHDLIYLNNSSCTLTFAGNRKLNVYGSPWTPQCGTFAFQYPPIRDVWTHTVPEDTDVLLTHGPPQGYLDLEGKGCPFLMTEVARVRPRLVVFGHIHVGHGQQVVEFRLVDICYQRIVTGNGALLTVAFMVLCLLYEWAIRLLCLVSGHRSGKGSKTTTMVNAAVLGGQAIIP